GMGEGQKWNELSYVKKTSSRLSASHDRIKEEIARKVFFDKSVAAGPMPAALPLVGVARPGTKKWLVVAGVSGGHNVGYFCQRGSITFHAFVLVHSDYILTNLYNILKRLPE
ncbi:MAG: hypothetical protein ACFNVX_09465, partial [Lachnoanaerobaculum saburreum]